MHEKGAGHIKLFGGGGGTILPAEIEELHRYGINRIYSPDDGRTMGLQGMINDLLQQCDFPTKVPPLNGEISYLPQKDPKIIGSLISIAENYPQEAVMFYSEIAELIHTKKTPVLGITGTGGSGKSSLVDELVRRFLLDFADKTIAIISVDPSKRKPAALCSATVSA